MKKINKLWFIPLALIVGLVGGLLISNDPESTDHVHTESEDGTVWTCSMHPQIRRNEPGQCPICGMDLIPVGDMESDNEDAVVLSSTAIRLGNVETVMVGTSGSPSQSLTLNGRVVPDENQIRSQSTHVAGRIERLYVNSAGETVRKGERIATLYSPQLIAAQQELLQAAAMASTQPELLEAAKEKLRSFRLSESQINSTIESGKIQDRMDIYAEYGGTVLEKRIQVGDHASEGEVLYVLSDLSEVWVEFDAYESDLPWINIGDVLRFTVAGVPGRTFEGKVTFIDPVVNPKTRVARIRVEVNNPEGILKPQMYATGTIETSVTDPESDLVIPRSSVMWTGRRSVVYVKEGAPESGSASFRLREVVLGPAIGDAYVVEEGLERGTEIVANGTFTVDAAAQLAGKPSMMNIDESTDRNSPVATGEVKEEVRPLLLAYVDLKNTLVESDLKTAKDHVKKMQNIVQALPVTEFTEEWNTWFKTFSGKLTPVLAEAASAENIDALRREFIAMSETMVELGKATSPLDGKLYIMRCPMANNNEGARWLSLENEVRNPYYGDMMLSCGSVTETIN